MLLHRLTASALLLLGFGVATVWGQPPVKPPVKSPAEKKADKASSTEAVVAAALIHDPDVQMARAKIQLAEAELAKSKQAVVLKVLALTATIQEHKQMIDLYKVSLVRKQQLVQSGVIQASELLADQQKLETLGAALARAETELKLLTGTAGTAFGAADPMRLESSFLLRARAHLDGQLLKTDTLLQMEQAVLDYNLRLPREAPVGDIADQIRTGLNTPVKLGAKGDRFTITQAFEAFKKEAGLDVPVRTMERGLLDHIKIESEGETLPIGAWLQLFEDDRSNPGVNFHFYLRDYGILFTNPNSAPKDALQLIEFWKMKPVKAKDVALPPTGGK